VWQYEIGIYPRNGEIPISSTMIREMIAQGVDISPFVPKAVVQLLSHKNVT
jgi:phosphopantetheine adenylyltransferase